MKGKFYFNLALILGLLIFIPPAGAQDLSGWWLGEAPYQEGDMATGSWVNLQAKGNKVSSLYVFQQTSETGTGYLLIWDDTISDYLKETYTFFVKNDLIALYVPTTIDAETNAAAGATLILRPLGLPDQINSMNADYTVFDTGTKAIPNYFVRMGSIAFTRVQVDKVPQLAQDKIP